jgi:gluconokinase
MMKAMTLDHTPRQFSTDPRCVIVMGVSGSGKTTLGRAMAQRWGDTFIEADDLHSPSDVEKMASGVPLNDDDRRPWLHDIGVRLRDQAQQSHRTVTACSALKRSYRDVLREYMPDAFFVELDGPIEVVRTRVASRHHEFMAPSLLDSQYATLEPLEADEYGTRLDGTKDVSEIVAVVEHELSGATLN